LNLHGFSFDKFLEFGPGKNVMNGFAACRNASIPVTSGSSEGERFAICQDQEFMRARETPNPASGNGLKLKKKEIRISLNLTAITEKALDLQPNTAFVRAANAVVVRRYKGLFLEFIVPAAEPLRLGSYRHRRQGQQN
jgi:hypothetical protein